MVFYKLHKFHWKIHSTFVRNTSNIFILFRFSFLYLQSIEQLFQQNNNNNWEKERKFHLAIIIQCSYGKRWLFHESWIQHLLIVIIKYPVTNVTKSFEVSDNDTFASISAFSINRKGKNPIVFLIQLQIRAFESLFHRSNRKISFIAKKTLFPFSSWKNLNNWIWARLKSIISLPSVIMILVTASYNG